jgi:hypothetical protein
MTHNIEIVKHGDGVISISGSLKNFPELAKLYFGTPIVDGAEKESPTIESRRKVLQARKNEYSLSGSRFKACPICGKIYKKSGLLIHNTRAHSGRNWGAWNKGKKYHLGGVKMISPTDIKPIPGELDITA